MPSYAGEWGIAVPKAEAHLKEEETRSSFWGSTVISKQETSKKESVLCTERGLIRDVQIRALFPSWKQDKVEKS